MALSAGDKRKVRVSVLRDIARSMGHESMRDAIARKHGISTDDGAENNKGPPEDPLLGQKHDTELPEDDLDVYRGEGVHRGEAPDDNEDTEELSEGESTGEKVRKLAKLKAARARRSS